LPPSIPAKRATWSAKLALLRDSLDELDSAMQAGRWEQLASLAAHADRAMHDLLAHPGHPSPDDAEALRQTLNLADALQAHAATRQQQILPLLQAWKTTKQADEPTP
jgi:hypothetical protein